jgi:hypothetical protein
MHNNNTLPPDILSLLTREQSNREPREVLKDKKIKRSKDISRLSEEIAFVKVSGETCPLTSTSSSSIGQLDISEEGLTSSRGEGCSNSETARTSIRGITAQHSRTNAGVKVMINIQTEEDALTGSVVELTAELKRSDRLRELKSYDHDSPEFDKEIFQMTMDSLRSMKSEERKPYCVGRIHDRGVRDMWYADMLAVGVLDDNDHLKTLCLNINGEEFEIDMDQPLSSRQEKSFHSNGIWGKIENQRTAPTLASAPRKVWK